jgi:hypothetical protein
MQPSSSSPRRPRRWLRLTALIAGIGALAVVGAALGRGLEAFDVGGAEARATIVTPAAVAAVMPAPDPTATFAAPTPIATPEASRPGAVFVTPSPDQGAGIAGSAARPAAPGSAEPTLTPSSGAVEAAGGSEGSAAHAPAPARLPPTNGDEMVFGLGALGIALYLAGLALFVVPRMFAGKHQEKE